MLEDNRNDNRQFIDGSPTLELELRKIIHEELENIIIPDLQKIFINIYKQIGED